MEQMLKLLTDMLDHACGKLTQAEVDDVNGGYQLYDIDVHCVLFVVSAKRDKSKSPDDLTRWDIRDWSKEDI